LLRPPKEQIKVDQPQWLQIDRDILEAQSGQNILDKDCFMLGPLVSLKSRSQSNGAGVRRDGFPPPKEQQTA
jgi:hypothetical protein